MTLSDFTPSAMLAKLGVLIAAGLLVIGVYTSIRNAYTERASLRTQVAALNKQIADERTTSDFNIAQANLTT